MNPLALRKTTALLITVAVLLLPVVLAGLYVADKHRWAQDRLDELEPRFARLMGLGARRDELQQIRTQAADMLARHTYTTELDVTQAGNDAQQRIRQIFSQAGLSIVSTQVLPPKTEPHFDRIALVVRADGELLALQSALMVLDNQKPSIFIDEMTLQLLGPVRGAPPGSGPRLASTFRVSVLKVRP